MPGIGEQVRVDLAETSLGRAITAAAAQRRVGAPVCLRCALEVGSDDDLVRSAAEVVEYALGVLGPAVDLYVAGAGRWDQHAAPAQVALTLRHRDGSVALLGVGRQSDQGPAAPPSLFLLGDRGVFEGDPQQAVQAVQAVQPLPTPVSGAGAGESHTAANSARRERLASIIRQSLETGRLVTLAEGTPDDG